MKIKHFLVFSAIFCLLGLPVHPQSSRDTVQDSSGYSNPAAAGIELPLKRIALLSSGVGYFEHSGTIGASASGKAEITLPFDAGAVNDALKSLVINDPASLSPSVRYASQNSLEQTLRSLKIDLSGSPGIGEILNGLKGAELKISAPNEILGRIIGVEYREAITPYSMQYNTVRSNEAWLSLFTAQGIRVIAVKDIASFAFTDDKINGDLTRALDLIMASRDENAKNLLVTLGGDRSRPVSLTYVIPAPVWKVSYRLDLSGAGSSGNAGSGKDPFLQGWAIVDNDSDNDWNGVELSLVTGRPVSFIQNLYPPYRLSRPVVPLAIAGIAESRTYESGYGDMAAKQAEMAMSDEYYDRNRAMILQAAPAPSAAIGGSGSVTGGVIETAEGRAAGDQFEFTLRNPVTLERRQSAMLPLVEGSVKAEKTLVFSGSRASGGVSIHPGISVELTNTSGMKLPAGPITVYDGGTYARDALIEFFPENEKRLITYGDDLSVQGSASPGSSRYVTGVVLSGGVMTINRRQSYERSYTIKNSSGENKKIIIEHPITGGSELVEPATAEDRTSSLYRFSRNLPAGETLTFMVKEETPVSERIALSQMRPDAFLSYSTSQEIPANVRAVLSRAIELKKKADDADLAEKDLERELTRFSSEQDRIRRNLEAAGNQSPQGQEYLKRLASLDSDIDSINARIDSALKDAQSAKNEYENYLATIVIPQDST